MSDNSNVILKFCNVTQILLYWQQIEFIVNKMLTLSRSVSSLVGELLSVPSASCYPLKTELNDGVYDIAIAVIQCTVRSIYTYKF